MDKHRTKRVRLEDLKGVASLVQAEEDPEQDPSGLNEEEAGRLTGTELIRRQEINDIYDQTKETLENLNLTLEAVIYNDLRFTPN